MPGLVADGPASGCCCCCCCMSKGLWCMPCWSLGSNGCGSCSARGAGLCLLQTQLLGLRQVQGRRPASTHGPSAPACLLSGLALLTAQAQHCGPHVPCQPSRGAQQPSMHNSAGQNTDASFGMWAASNMPPPAPPTSLGRQAEICCDGRQVPIVYGAKIMHSHVA